MDPDRVRRDDQNYPRGLCRAHGFANARPLRFAAQQLGRRA